MGLMWTGPIIGAIENKSLTPLALWAAPISCLIFKRQWEHFKHQRKQFPAAVTSLAALVAATALIHLGLQPVGGLLGPGGWFFWLFITGLCLNLFHLKKERDF